MCLCVCVFMSQCTFNETRPPCLRKGSAKLPSSVVTGRGVSYELLLIKESDYQAAMQGRAHMWEGWGGRGRKKE